MFQCSMLILDCCLLISHLILCSFVICSVSFRIRCAVYMKLMWMCWFTVCFHIVFLCVKPVVVFTFFFSFRCLLLSVPLSRRQLQLRIFESVFRNLFIGFGRLAFFFNAHFLICFYLYSKQRMMITACSQSIRNVHSRSRFELFAFLLACLSVYGTNLHLSEFKHLFKYRRCSIELHPVLFPIQVFKLYLFRLLNWIQRLYFNGKWLQIFTQIPRLWRGAGIGYKMS